VNGFEALFAVQQASYRRADGALRGSWPEERAMGLAELEAFLGERRYCVLATTTGQGHAQARPVAFAVVAGAFWFATVAGGRLRNLERTPWASVVVSEGDIDRHRAVTADGPVTITGQPAERVLDAWAARLGSQPDWAQAWIELRPERLFSYTRA
jgi:nitroimidazol reductase NimA-like FMN-containing flavoprotein (pyridoxamine 5'-phosphate oxidase superfamily)